MYRYALSTCLFGALALFGSDSHAQDEHAVDFHRDIRPLLSDACFHCHGPDEETQEAGLRLDVEDAAKQYAIVEGDPDASEVMQRILTDDPDQVMPPPASGKSLTIVLRMQATGTPRSLTSCLTRLITASVGAAFGSTRHATPTRTGTR